MKINTLFNPKANETLARLEAAYTPLMMDLFDPIFANAEIVTPADQSKNLETIEKLDALQREYSAVFFTRFKTDAALADWLKTAQAPESTLEYLYIEECRAIRDRAVSPAMQSLLCAAPLEVANAYYDTHYRQPYAAFVAALKPPAP